MIDVVAHLDVDRPAGDVFAFVSHQLNAPRWQRGLHEVRRTTDGPIGVGSEHVFVRRFAGRRIESRNRFVEFEPDRYVAFEIPDGAMTERASYLVAPIDTTRKGSSLVSAPSGSPRTSQRTRSTRRSTNARPDTPATG